MEKEEEEVLEEEEEVVEKEEEDEGTCCTSACLKLLYEHTTVVRKGAGVPSQAIRLYGYTGKGATFTRTRTTNYCLQYL